MDKRKGDLMIAGVKIPNSALEIMRAALLATAGVIVFENMPQEVKIGFWGDVVNLIVERCGTEVPSVCKTISKGR